MEEKVNVFKELALSVWDFKSYRKFLNNKGGRVFGFSALLLGIYLLLNTLFMAFSFFGVAGVLKSEFMRQIPDFVLEDGVLTVEKEVEYEGSGAYIYVNTDEHISAEELEEILRTHSTVAVLDDTGLVLQSNTGERQMVTYGELQEMIGSVRYTQDDLKILVEEYMPYVYIFMLIALFVIDLGSIASFYIRIVAVSLIVLIIASVMNLKLSYGRIFTLSIYTRTVPVLLRLLLNLLPFSLPFFWVIDIAVSCVYAALALDAIKKSTQQPCYYPGQMG